MAGPNPIFYVPQTTNNHFIWYYDNKAVCEDTDGGDTDGGFGNDGEFDISLFPQSYI